MDFEENFKGYRVASIPREYTDHKIRMLKPSVKMQTPVWVRVVWPIITLVGMAIMYYLGSISI